MNEYGIADVGSNTIVLILYTMEQGHPVQKYYESRPAHLIDYVDEQKHMSKQGIEKAFEVLSDYAKICEVHQVIAKWADITEPCRITNQEELVNQLKATGFEIYPLSGQEEAIYDYIGTQYSWPNIEDGIAFDVGGGSTELIAFQNKTVQEAVSIPLGCVRLGHLPLHTEKCRQALENMQNQYPALNTQSTDLIGIGGTMRAACNAYCRYYETQGSILKTNKLKTYFDLIERNDAKAVTTMKQTVDPARIPVFLPGLHMILTICDLYQAKQIYVSATGIREGFFLTRYNERK